MNEIDEDGISEIIKDEITFLTSSYPNCMQYTFIEGKYVGCIYVKVDIPNDFCIKFGPKAEHFPIEYLPPIQLCFELKTNYPSWGPPGFSLICRWLTPFQLSNLCDMLDEIWKRRQNEVVIFDWASALRQNTLSHLGLGSSIDLSELMQMNKALKSKLDTLKALNHHCRFTPYENIPTRYGHHPFDQRALTDWDHTSSLKAFLINYNASQAMEAFNKGRYLCNVCFEDLPGRNCIKFQHCGHIFCRPCCREYFEIQIKDGNVKLLNCLEENCSSQAHPGQVRELVSPELYDRYDYLLLTTALDTMPDVIFCPMRRCGQAVIMESQEEKMATCPSCKHAFCLFCRKTYHGIEPCKINKQEKQMIVKLYQNGDSNERNRLETRYGRRELEKLMEECLSEEWVTSHSKKCPSCSSFIEKIEGCHKMTCKKCNSCFCWLCMKVLDSANPYRHYNEETSSCFNLLFQGLAMDGEEDEEEDEDWQFGRFL